MKIYLFILMSLSLFASCGKDNVSAYNPQALPLQEQVVGPNALTASGLKLVAGPSTQGVMAGVICENSRSTNQEKMNVLIEFKNSIAVGMTSTNGYQVNNYLVPTPKMDQILSEAIGNLRSSNPASTVCPRATLSTVPL